MEARELRIGNFVEYGNDIEQITIHHLFGVLNGDDVQPIPLTEKWLLNLGFEFNEFHKNYKVKVDYYHHSIKFYQNEWVYSNDISDASCHTITSIQYVHQLQNIYFALTGEELTIKNEAQ